MLSETCYKTRMTELRVFLKTRRTQVEEELQPLAAKLTHMRAEMDGLVDQIAGLSKELEEIKRAEHAIAGEDADRPVPGARLTIKEAVLKVLQDGKRAMTAQEILAAINERFFGGTIARSSLSPQLSRLNHMDKKITYDGTKWSLERENAEGPAKAEPSVFD